jgi:NADH-quinone oxidoreductase subunit L
MIAETNLLRHFIDPIYTWLPMKDPVFLEHTLFIIPLLPLLGFLFNGLFGTHVDKKVSGWIAVFAALGSFLWALMAVNALGTMTDVAETRNVLHPVYGTWLKTSDFSFSFGLILDQLSSVMILVVTGIGTLIHLYSMGYMAHDAGFSRFFAYLNLFLFAMILLVLGDNLMILFVGWEGVGLCSYLLIGFWYEDGKNAAAGMKAFVVNRIGDLGFLLGIFILLAVFGTVNYVASPTKMGGQRVTRQTTMIKEKVMLPKEPGLIDYAEGLRLLNKHGDASDTAMSVGAKVPVSMGNLDLSHTAAARMPAFAGTSMVWILTLACSLLFVGAMGKSAQIPLYVWLPDAMAGPTPVSALIHAATMVTAGVYMVVRLSGLFTVSPEALQMIAIVGGSTALMAALIGLTQLDIKKVLAYSTVSQLGYMFLGLGVGAFSLGIFHVLTHAFFKALLFLGAGSVIHAMSGEQDMRYMGNLRKKLPVTFWTMVCGSIALAGVPYIGAGWWSKDEILGHTLLNYEASHQKMYLILYVMGCAAAFCTAFYTTRLIGLTFFGESRAKPEAAAHIHESPLVMTLPLIVLAVFSIIGGALWHDKFVGENSHLISELGIRNVELMSLTEHEIHHVHQINFIVTLLAAMGGIALGALLYIKKGKVPNPDAAKSNFIYRLSLNKFYVDEAYQAMIITPFVVGSEILHWSLETLVIDLLVTGTGYMVAFFSGMLRRIQTGLINSYAAAILFGALAVLVFLSWH